MKALVFSLLLIPILGHASDQPALPLRVTVEKDVSPNIAQQLSGIVPAAVTFVHMFQPKGYENNIFNWSADRKILEGKSLQIVLATSKNSTFEPLLKNSSAANTDAFTVAPITDGTMSIFLVLLVDRIFYDELGHERKYGFSKLILALAHEIYGNVQQLLELSYKDAKPQTMQQRILYERNSYQASLMFLCGLRENKEFSNMPASIREGLMSLLPSEIMAYRSWQNANPSLELDPACEAMLKSVTGKDRK